MCLHKSPVAVGLNPAMPEWGVCHNETRYCNHLQKSIFAVGPPNPIRQNVAQDLMCHQVETDARVLCILAYCLHGAE